MTGSGRRLRIENLTRGGEVADCAERAASFVGRAMGLMGRRGWDGSDGLILEHCNSVHSFFMRMPIDVAFVDKSGRVLKIVEQLAPWRIAPIAWRAAWTLELPGGRLAQSGTRVGDELRLADA